jgi:MtN3 and saliva related transmembrane protein
MFLEKPEALRAFVAGLKLGTSTGLEHCARMLTIETLVGFVAAFCTTVSYVPQVKKCWQTGSAGDLSLKMLLILATGIALWVVYGVLKSDMVIVIANTVSLLLLCNLLVFKIRENSNARQHKPA